MEEEERKEGYMEGEERMGIGRTRRRSKEERLIHRRRRGEERGTK